MSEVNYYDIIFGVIFTSVGGYLVGATKDDDPNRKVLKGFGIFSLVLGCVLISWEVLKYFNRNDNSNSNSNSNNNGNTTVNPMYEIPQSAVVEPSAEQPVVNVPNGTVIVNNPAGNTGVGRRNNARAN